MKEVKKKEEENLWYPSLHIDLLSIFVKIEGPPSIFVGMQELCLKTLGMLFQFFTQTIIYTAEGNFAMLNVFLIKNPFKQYILCIGLIVK